EKIKEEQSADVDTISGATNSSKGYLEAVENAIEKSQSEQKSDSASDGTHKGSAEGYKGPIEVEVTFENGEITDITVAEHEETEDIAEPAFDDLEEKIKEEQSADVDTISGATNSSEGYLEAVENAIENSQSEQKSDGFSDGTHKGSAEGYKGPIEVEVEVENGEIIDIEVADHNETEGIGDEAFPKIIEEIISSQEIEVDTVSGATNSSKGLIKAVKDALE
ncbi:MAG: FMN-binding protein, partial [Halanaerobiales bacterium]